MTTPDAATTATTAAASDCAHVYASEHKPGHRIYWLRYCMLCGKPDWDEVDRQVDELLAKAREDERQRIRDGSDRWPGGIAGPAWYKVPADLLDGAS